MLQKGLVTIVLAVAAASLATAGKDSPKSQTPNLSGTWKLERSKGNYASYAQLRKQDDLTLLISHADPEIRVISKLLKNGNENTLELTYYTDGRGELGHTFIGDLHGKSITGWRGNKLVSRFSVNAGPGPKVPLDVVQEWKLSRDGKTLTQSQILRQTEVRTSGGSSSEALIAEEMARIYVRSLGDNEITRDFTRVP